MNIEDFRKIKPDRGESAKYGNLCWYCRFNCSTKECNKHGHDCDSFIEMDNSVKRAYTYQAFKELKESYNDSLNEAHNTLSKLTKGYRR